MTPAQIKAEWVTAARRRDDAYRERRAAELAERKWTDEALRLQAAYYRATRQCD